MEKPIIFLDFDGVLNTERYVSRQIVDGRPYRDGWGICFDPRSVANLQRIIEATDARIVVTSTWRYLYGLRDLRKMWDERGLPGNVQGVLPSDSLCLSRGEEIEDWVRDHGCANYVIIDDVDEFSPAQHDRYVEVNPIFGITGEDVLKAKKILGQTIKHDQEQSA